MCYGSEFISRDMDLWAYQRGLTLDLAHPGKPGDNPFIEAFNSKPRSECLGIGRKPVSGDQVRCRLAGANGEAASPGTGATRGFVDKGGQDLHGYKMRLQHH